MKRAKLLNIICSITVSVLFILILMLGLVLTGVISVNANKLVLKSDDGQTVYNGVPLTAESWRLISGELKEGHTIEASFSGMQTYAGSSQNMFYVIIRDEFGTDVTSDYDITFEYGTLEVLPKPLKIVSGSAQKLYDGKPLTCSDWSYYPENGLVANNHIEVDVVGSITDMGMAMNTIGSVSIYNESGKDVTGNYQITLEPGLLTVIGAGGGLGGLDGLGGMIDGNGALDLSGQISGNELGSNGSNIICYRVYNKVDDTVYLKIKSFGEYNGNAWLEASEYDKLIDGEHGADYLTGSSIGQMHSRIEIESLNGQYALPYYMKRTYSAGYDPQSSDIMYVGNTDTTYALYYSKYNYGDAMVLPDILIDYEKNYRNFVYSQYLEIDDQTRDYMNYIILSKKFSGNDMDTILKVAAYIQGSAEYDLEYDRTLDSESNVAIAFLDSYKRGICQHYATAATLLYRAMGIPARYTVGFVAETEAGTWVDVTAETAHAWVEVYLDGIGWVQVEVTGSSGGSGGGDGSGSGDGGNIGDGSGEGKFKATIKPVSVSKLWDGTPLEASQLITGFEMYQQLGYTIQVSVSGSRTDPGKSNSTIDKYLIFGPDGKEANGEFSVTLEMGTIQVYISELKFKSENRGKVYDGTALSTNLKDCSFVNGDLLHTNVKISYSNASSITDVGSKAADFKVKLVADGVDITEFYKITKECGTLTVEHRKITVKADDAQKVYDGTPLISDSCSIIDGELVNGHEIESYIIKIEQERIGVGRSQCIPSDIVICDGNGTDVTKNYSIKYEEGTLRVLPE